MRRVPAGQTALRRAQVLVRVLPLPDEPVVAESEDDPEGWNRAVEVDEALRADGSIVTRGFRQKLYLYRTCEPLVQIDFWSLAPNTLDPMITGECLGLCGN